MAYSDKVLDHYENPRNVGKLDASDECRISQIIDPVYRLRRSKEKEHLCR